MAGRPRKPKKTIDEQILEIENDIVKYKEAVTTLENKKEELLTQKREEEMFTLYDLIQTKGITIEEATSILETYDNNKNTNNNVA